VRYVAVSGSGFAEMVIVFHANASVFIVCMKFKPV